MAAVMKESICIELPDSQLSFGLKTGWNERRTGDLTPIIYGSDLINQKWQSDGENLMFYVFTLSKVVGGQCLSSAFIFSIGFC